MQFRKAFALVIADETHNIFELSLLMRRQREWSDNAHIRIGKITPLTWEWVEESTIPMTEEERQKRAAYIEEVKETDKLLAIERAMLDGFVFGHMADVKFYPSMTGALAKAHVLRQQAKKYNFGMLYGFARNYAGLDEPITYAEEDANLTRMIFEYSRNGMRTTHDKPIGKVRRCGRSRADIRRAREASGVLHERAYWHHNRKALEARCHADQVPAQQRRGACKTSRGSDARSS